MYDVYQDPFLLERALVFGLVVVGAIWVGMDAKRIGIRKGAIQGFFNMGPIGWFFSCLLLFLLAFPMYLVKRAEFLRKNEVKPSAPDGAQPAVDTKQCPFCAETIQAAAIKCRFCGESLSAALPPQAGSGLGIAAVTLGAAGVLMPYFAAVFLVPSALICGFLAYRRGQRGLGAAGLILGILGIISIGYTSQKLTEIVRDPFSASLPGTPAPIVTLAKFNAIEEGMSYERVRLIIQASGEELSRTDLGGFTTIMYAWRNANGSNMNAMFQNGKLVSKAQLGLR